MTPDKNDLHPEMWHEQPQELPTAITDNEEIRAVICLELNDPKQKIYNIFAIIETPTELSARIIITNTGSDLTHQVLTHEFAHYPKTDKTALIKEVKTKALGFAEFIQNVKPGNLTIDTNVPLMFLEAKDGITDTRKTIKDGLNIKNAPPAATGLINAVLDAFSIEDNFQIAPVQPVDPTLNNIERAAQEMALIQKFGKKKIESLAKKMNYHGAVINKLN